MATLRNGLTNHFNGQSFQDGSADWAEGFDRCGERRWKAIEKKMQKP
jgi:hypothetical protein